MFDLSKGDAMVFVHWIMDNLVIIFADENNTPQKFFFGPGKNHMLNMYYRSVMPVILFRMIFCLFCLFDTSLIFVLLRLISQVKYHIT